MLGSHWVTSPVTVCCFAEATSIVSVVLVSHTQDSAANIKKERKENPWHVPGFLHWVSCVPSCHSAGTVGAGETQPLSVRGCSCWGAWGTVLVPGTQRFVDSTIKCYGILICSLVIFHFLNFWHSDAILLKRLPGDINTFLELKMWLAKNFPRISSLTPIPFPREGLGLLWGLWLEMHT